MFWKLLTLVLFVQVNPPAWDLNRTSFIIHGVWPQYPNGSWPEYCCHSPECDYNRSLILDLIPNMTEWWGDGSSQESLWKHEWLKHGTCSGMDEHSFFQTGLKWRQQNPMRLILQDSGLQPNKNYSQKEFISKLTNQLGYQPVITCKGNLLDEVELCFWDGEVGDCPDTVPSYCPTQLYY